MDILATYGKTIFDIGIILIFLFIILLNIPLGRLFNALKGLMVVVVLWFIAKTFGLALAESTLYQVVQFGLLGLIIMFPRDFRLLLENLGRRKIFSWNTDRLIEKQSRKELAEAVVELARTKQGGTIVIARRDGLDDEAISGNYVGEMDIKKDFIVSLLQREAKTNQGAMIIRDDKIISTNVKLPMLRNQHLENNGAGKRHLGALGIVKEKDCIVIVMSAETGTISFFSKRNGKPIVDFGNVLKDMNVIDGIDEDIIADKVYRLLKDLGEEQKKEKPKKEPKVKEKAKPKAVKPKAVKPKNTKANRQNAE